MALSDDQKAILRLLSQRGEQGYEDLAALIGVDPAKVHERALAAAAQLESEGIPAPPIPTPPGSAADAGPAGKTADPEPEPPAPPKPPPPRESAPSSPAWRPRLALPKGNGARAAIAAATAVLVALVVVLLVSGGDDSGDTPAAEETVSANANPKLTQAVLSPTDGGDAKGVATFGRVKNSLALQVEAEGLDPTDQGESYTIWLYDSPRKMLPLASTAVGADGKIGAQVEVPTEVLAFLADETFDQLDISLTTDATLKASLAKATREKKAPIYTGEDVLRGTITGPIIGAANKK